MTPNTRDEVICEFCGARTNSPCNSEQAPICHNMFAVTKKRRRKADADLADQVHALCAELLHAAITENYSTEDAMAAITKICGPLVKDHT